MEATLRRDENCGQYNFPKFWFKSQTCYSIPGQSSICDVDSGGPLVFKKHGKPICLIGISSFMEQFCDLRYPGVFTSVGFFHSWINKKT